MQVGLILSEGPVRASCQLSIFCGSVQLICWKILEASQPKANLVSQTEVAELDSSLTIMFAFAKRHTPCIVLQATGLPA